MENINNLDISYNIFLYNKRIELNLSTKEFAKMLHINSVYYDLIEKGYLKPTVKTTNKISDALGIDFSTYLDGIRSYPTPIPKKIEGKRDRLVLKKNVRILWVILTFCFFSLFLGTLIASLSVKNKQETYLPRTYQRLVNGVRDNGELTHSLTGSFNRPEIYEKDYGGLFVSIIGDYNKQNPFALTMQYTEYKDDFRITYSLDISKQNNDHLDIQATYVDYQTYDIYTKTYSYYSKTNYVSTKTLNYLKEPYEDAKIDSIFDTYYLNFEDSINNLVFNHLYMNLSLENDILQDLIPIKDTLEKTLASLNAVYLFSVIAFGISAIILVYAFLYGKRKYGAFILEPLDFERKVLLVHKGKKKPPKDILFGPFIPETIYQVIGAILTFLASIFVFVEIGLHVAGKENIISGSSLNSLITILVTGTIFLFFVDFDSFIGDRRSIRFVFLYAILFFVVLNVQIVIINSINGFAIGKLFLSQYKIILPNYLGSISMYFLIMVFLFTNPKIANTKKKLIIYRSLSIIPILFLITSHLLESLNTIYNYDFNTTLQYVLTGHRPQITILVILYLVGLYFIRLIFKKRYGKEACKSIFNGNRYLIIKNVYAFAITCIISIVEGILYNNTLAHSFGLGLYPRFILLGAILLFYRPHIGIRKNGSERLTFVSHTVFFAMVYIVIALILAGYYLFIAI